jgi:hypothetical protein
VSAGPVSGAIVRLAVRVLPAGGARERYRREFLAELAACTRTARLRFALGVLSSVVALRAALAGSALLVGPVDPPMGDPERRRPLLCRLRLHRFVACHNPDGEFYLRCRRCGVDRYDPEGDGQAIGGNIYGGGLGQY